MTTSEWSAPQSALRAPDSELGAMEAKVSEASHASTGRRSSRARSGWIPIGVLALVLVGALIIGRGQPDHSNEARARSIASGIKCLICQGLSVEQSKAASARLIYTEIQRQVANGRTDADIRGYLVGRFGKELLLTPASTGEASVVWILPVALIVGAFAGLAIVFRRWKRVSAGSASEAELSSTDAALVRRALDQRRASAPETTEV